MSGSAAVQITIRMVGIPGPGTSVVAQAEAPLTGQGLPGNLVFETSTAPATVWLNEAGTWVSLGVLGGGTGGGGGGGGVAGTAADSLAAEGVNEAGALPLTATISRFILTPPGSGGQSEPFVVGTPSYVVNDGNAPLLVYPPAGAAFLATAGGVAAATLGVGNPVSLPVGDVLTIVPLSNVLARVF